MDVTRLPNKAENNLWYRYNDSDAVLVFVHGVLSDSRDCWLHEETTKQPEGETKQPICYWPELIESDARFKDVAIYLAGYYTAVNSGDFPIQQCAQELFSYLKTPDPLGRPPVIDRKKITFVCHSMGGIVARYLLCEEWDFFKDKQVGIVLIASPSYGSKLAHSLDYIIHLYNHSQGKQLRWGSEILKEVDRRFKNVMEKLPRLSGIEFYENRFLIHWKWLPFLTRTRVVSEESGVRYFGSAKQVGDSDHSTICKPRMKTDRVHQFLFDFLLEKDLLPAQTAPATDSSSSEIVEGQPLPAPPTEALRNAWHPPEDLRRRGPLTECQFTLDPNYQSDGKKRWDKYGDVLVQMDHPPTADYVYLVPSRKSPRRFRDPKMLEDTREAKQRLTARFVKSIGSRRLDGLWFAKTMATDATQRVHVYAEEYDNFLNTHAATTERNLVYISYKTFDKEWRLRLRRLLDADERIEVWDDSKLIPGIDYREQIKEHVSRTRVMIILASQEYLDAPLPNELELTPAIQAADSGELSLLWVPIRPFDFQSSPLGRFMAPVDPRAPLAGMSEPEWQAALDTLYQAVLRVLV